MADSVLLPPSVQRVQAIAHALGAPLCALEVVLASKHHLPEAHGALLADAVDRLRQILAEAQGQGPA